MSWTQKSYVYQRQGSPIYTVKWMGIADASDLADEKIVDLSTLRYDGANTPSYSEVVYFKVAAGGVTFLLEWDATADDPILVCPPGTQFTYGGFADDPEAHANLWRDPKSTGSTGDVLASTTGGAAGASVYLELTLLLLA